MRKAVDPLRICIAGGPYNMHCASRHIDPVALLPDFTGVMSFLRPGITCITCHHIQSPPVLE